MARRGARRSGTPLPARLRNYFSHHAQVLISSLGRLWRQPFASVMTLLVIGVALALPAVLHLLVQNARAATGQWDSVLDVSVYLSIEQTTQQGEALAGTLRKRDDVARIDVIAADQALADFRTYSGFGNALDALTDNPLPVTLVVTPADDHRDDLSLAALADEIRGFDGVDLVQLDTAWVKRFHAILDMIRRGVWLAGVLLAVAVLVIIGNTIRMEILNRREEIEIVKLVGASDGFIRRPFLYSGLWYGLGGGIMASLITVVIGMLLAGPVHQLAGHYGSAFRLLGLGGPALVLLVGGGAALGLLGSWIAATRHMRRIEPA
ncbi:MAG: permease-like cell division protein FtsX [Pseudomonadota bacterium]